MKESVIINLDDLLDSEINHLELFKINENINIFDTNTKTKTMY